MPLSQDILHTVYEVLVDAAASGPRKVAALNLCSAVLLAGKEWLPQPASMASDHRPADGAAKKFAHVELSGSGVVDAAGESPGVSAISDGDGGAGPRGGVLPPRTGGAGDEPISIITEIVEHASGCVKKGGLRSQLGGAGARVLCATAWALETLGDMVGSKRHEAQDSLTVALACEASRALLGTCDGESDVTATSRQGAGGDDKAEAVSGEAVCAHLCMLLVTLGTACSGSEAARRALAYDVDLLLWVAMADVNNVVLPLVQQVGDILTQTSTNTSNAGTARSGPMSGAGGDEPVAATEARGGTSTERAEPAPPGTELHEWFVAAKRMVGSRIAEAEDRIKAIKQIVLKF